MHTLVYPLSGNAVTLHINRRAKKNIILRPHGKSSLHISIPPWLSQNRLQQWLRANEPLLAQMLAKAACTPPIPQNTLPEWIWWHGRKTPLVIQSGATQIRYDESSLHLPDAAVTPLQQWLWQQAGQHLLPKLATHAQAWQKQPARIALTRAKTFWGVCRQRTGIRLNWRLIGAPEAVQDYVCLHEIAHLTHADHSPQFWQLVQHYYPNYPAAQHWLKQHGRELFTLG